MAHDALDPAFRRLIDEHAPVRQVGSGFTFTEGPIWHPVDQYLLFSDMPADVRRRLDRSGAREVLRPSNKANGLTYDADLNLIACEHATSSVARFRPDGTREVLASHFEGRELNSPNDLCVHSSGAIYFSDPWYGRMPHYGVERPRDLGWQGVFRLAPGSREPKLLVDRYMFSQPNGLCFCPDESKLYVNDTEQANIRVFDVRADGTLANARVFASGIRDVMKPGVPDGMKCDAQGNIWVTAPGWLVGLRAGRPPHRQGCDPRAQRQPALGRAGLAHALRLRDDVGLCDRRQGRAAQRALHARARIGGSSKATAASASTASSNGADASGDLSSTPRAVPSSSRTCRTTW